MELGVWRKAEPSRSTSPVSPPTTTVDTLAGVTCRPRHTFAHQGACQGREVGLGYFGIAKYTQEMSRKSRSTKAAVNLRSFQKPGRLYSIMFYRATAVLPSTTVAAFAFAKIPAFTPRPRRRPSLDFSRSRMDFRGRLDLVQASGILGRKGRWSCTQ